MSPAQIDPVSFAPLRRGSLGSRHRIPAPGLYQTILLALLLTSTLILGFAL
jgi:hypothetical protein